MQALLLPYTMQERQIKHEFWMSAKYAGKLKQLTDIRKKKHFFFQITERENISAERIWEKRVSYTLIHFNRYSATEHVSKN